MRVGNRFVTEWNKINRRAVLGCGVLFGFRTVAPYRLIAANLPVLDITREQQAISGRTFYVANSGQDSGAGTIQSPFRTISQVFEKVSDLGPNDTILASPGTYNEQIVVNKGGDSTGYLHLRSQIKHGARIRSPIGTYSAINIIKDFVIVEGFDVQAGGHGHGIEATFLDGNPENDGPHHVQILDNICHHNAGSGIGCAYGDFILIEGNICHDNCSTNNYQGSGISIYEARAISAQIPGYHNIIRNNVCYRNMILKVGNVPHSDGNGIIIDDFRNSQRKKFGNYLFDTLIENNLVYNNGAKGIQIFYSDRVTVRNNTSYHNNMDPLNLTVWRGELSNTISNEITWVNNIAVANPLDNPSNTAISEYELQARPDSNVAWYNNLTFNGRPGDSSLHTTRKNASLTTNPPFNNLFGIDPEFVDADFDSTIPNFRLRPGSTAVANGTMAFGYHTTDIDNNMRASGKIDIGAYACKN